MQLPKTGELIRCDKGGVMARSSRGDGVREGIDAGSGDSQKKWKIDGKGEGHGECDGDGVPNGSGDVGADECISGAAVP